MDLFGSVKNFLKPSRASIDNFAFKLTYKFTFVLLIASSVLVTARQYFGDPIDCISRDNIPPALLDTYCWVHTTFSIPDAWNKVVGEEVPYPGVDKYTEGETRKYHAYYQWVWFVLFFMSILFYVPRYFWKSMEGNRIKNLIQNLDLPTLTAAEKEKNRKVVVDYLLNYHHQHNSYFCFRAVAEAMNFATSVGLIFLVDRFLGGEFTSYGLEVLNFSEWDNQALRYDPMVRVFPRMTKCTFHAYGSSGDVQRHDAMCILPINIINEKIFIVLWFWMIALCIITGLALIYRALTYFYPSVRYFMTQNVAQHTDKARLAKVLSKCNAGDWLIFHSLCNNIDPLNFRDIINDLAARLDEKGSLWCKGPAVTEC
ncbi:innexin inx2 [Caerostris darwini]|uniref:Innexin n=1 Tax=Caerostris darwini TaxID=1538125 RepID=A0AAV4X2L1_9ARAC|nr:innexin inx2 [Caerostris darwini]